MQTNTEQENEDEQLKQAMAASLNDVPGQENGTIGGGQHFGPAQRAHYNPSQWGMVPIASSREFVDHPPPQKRRRRPGEPAFLRGSPETGYNAPLLTIYHSIPLAREALIFPPLQVLEYGHNPEWWSGASDENSKSLSMQESSPGAEDRKKFSAEIQCLMAFLDNTNRAYGSVEALSELRFYQYFQAETPYTKLAEAWQTAAMEESPNQPLTQIFTSIAAQGPEIRGASPEEKELLQIEAAVREAQSQTEILDKIFWNDVSTHPIGDVWMERFGHVVTLRILNDESGASKLGITPTEVWYVDRYTPALREKMFEMRQRRHTLLKDIENLNKTQHKIAEMPGVKANTSRVNIRTALEAAKELMPLAVDDTLRAQTNLIEVSDKTDAAQIQKSIDHLLGEIDGKVKAIKQRKSELNAQIKVIMSDLTDPNTSTIPLREKFVLQGVSTKPNVTYVRKFNRDLIGMDDNEDEPHEAWQWWRTAWDEPPNQQSIPSDSHTNGFIDQSNDMDDSVPFSVSRVSVEEVLEAAKNEHRTAILIYANETAMTFAPSPLPSSLRKFVEQDNRAFEDEMFQKHVQQVDHERRWSNETNSTAMDDTNPFNDTTYAQYGREATPMTTSTIRSLSGQPSPKRSRSSDDSMRNINLMDDEPPSYDDAAAAANTGSQEMHEKRGNRIGYFAEQFLHDVEQKEQNQQGERESKG